MWQGHLEKDVCILPKSCQHSLWDHDCPKETPKLKGQTTKWNVSGRQVSSLGKFSIMKSRKIKTIRLYSILQSPTSLVTASPSQPELFPLALGFHPPARFPALLLFSAPHRGSAALLNTPTSEEGPLRGGHSTKHLKVKTNPWLILHGITKYELFILLSMLPREGKKLSVSDRRRKDCKSSRLLQKECLHFLRMFPGLVSLQSPSTQAMLLEPEKLCSLQRWQLLCLRSLTDLSSITGSCSCWDAEVFFCRLLTSPPNDLPPANHCLLRSILHTAVSIFLQCKLYDILSLLKCSDSSTSPTVYITD